MRLVSSTLFTVAFLALFVVAPDPVPETKPVTTTPVTTPVTTPGTTSSTSDKPATTPAKKDTPATTPVAPGKPPSPVKPKVVGTLKEGDACVKQSTPEETCGQGLDCAIGARYYGGKNPGYCVKSIEKLTVGDVCVKYGCKKGLYCKRDPANPKVKEDLLRNPKGKCTEESKLGEKCSDSSECIDGTFCLSGKCVKKL
jgi:hypothetical protein